MYPSDPSEVLTLIHIPIIDIPRHILYIDLTHYLWCVNDHRTILLVNVTSLFSVQTRISRKSLVTAIIVGHCITY